MGKISQLALFIGCAAAASLALAGCGSQAPAPVTVKGIVDYQGGGGWSQSSGPCEYGPSPAQVTLESGSHTVLASAQLWKGTLRDSADCMLSFTFSGVPGSDSQYGVSVPGHGTVWFSRAQINSTLSLSLSG
jgi:hypothetical protein